MSDTTEPLAHCEFTAAGPSWWNTVSQEDGIRRRVLIQSDLVVATREFRRRVFDAIDRTPNLDWLVSTDHPERIAETMPAGRCPKDTNGDGDCGRICDHLLHRIRPNLWLGARVRDQAEADARIPHLLRVPAAVRWLDMRGMRGPANLSWWLWEEVDSGGTTPWGESINIPMPTTYIDWVVAGGGAEPVHPDWIRSLRDQCVAAGVPFWFESWGEWKPLTTTAGIQTTPFGDYDVASKFGFARVGSARSGDLLDGVRWKQLPEVKRA